MQFNFLAIPSSPISTIATVSDMNGGGIYILLNTINGKVYVGSTKYFYKRYYDHFLNLRNNTHSNSYLQLSWNKHGEIFKFAIIETILNFDSLSEIEQLWIDAYNSYDRSKGYNLRPTACNNSGFVWSDEQRANLSKAKKGFKHSEETKIKLRFKKPLMSERMKGNKFNLGRKYTEEDRIKNAMKPRKINKWPHDLGSKCRCTECRNKLNQEARNRRANKASQ